MSDSQHVDSLDEFLSESLDPHSSSPGEGLPDSAGLFVSVPASPAGDSTPSGTAPMSWRRRRGRLHRVISAAKASFSGRVRIQPPGRSALDREGRRTRIRQTISTAAGRDTLARVATTSRLAPRLARMRTSSGRFWRRLRGGVQPLAVKAHVLAVHLRDVTLRAAATSTTRARGAVESSVRFARQLPSALHLHLHPIAVKARSVAVRLRHGAPRAMAALRLAGRMLHPRSVAAAGAMLALFVIARPDNGPTDMSAGRAVPPTTPAAVSTGAIAPAVRSEKMVDAGAPPEEIRLATPQTAVAKSTVAKANIPPVAAPANRMRPINTRAVQTVLNRYRDALSTLDVTAVRAVWPNADAGALRKEFAGIVEQNVEFEACRISGVETGARASCAGVIESGFKAGERRPRVERRHWQFTLRESGNGWQIIEVRTERD